MNLRHWCTLAIQRCPCGKGNNGQQHSWLSTPEETYRYIKTSFNLPLNKAKLAWDVFWVLFHFSIFENAKLKSFRQRREIIHP